MSYDKPEDEHQQFKFRLYSADREGWCMTYDSLEQAESSLEWIDIDSGEYLLIDNDAHLYEAIESSSGHYGYKLRKSAETRPDALSVLERYSDGQQLTKPDLELLGHGMA